MKRRFFALILVGFLFVLDVGGWTQQLQAQSSSSSYPSEVQGEIDYREGKWSLAISQWHEALANYENQQNTLAQGRVLSKLALAYAQSGQWNLAEQAISESVTLLKPEADPQTLAQAYNNWGNLDLMRGWGRKALNNLQNAQQLYQQAGDKKGVLISQINQARAFKLLGRYRFSCQKLLQSIDFSVSSCDDLTLEDIDFELQQIDFPIQEPLLSAWLTFADILRKLGKFKESLEIIAVIQQKIPSDRPQGELWLSVGKTLQLQGEQETALKAYQTSLEEDYQDLIKLEAELLLLNLYLAQNPPNFPEAISLITLIGQQIEALPASHSQIEQTINYLTQLIKLKTLNLTQYQLPSWEKITLLAQNTLAQAEILEDQRSISYTLGILGKIYEKKQQWSTSQQLTAKALAIAEAINTPEMVYLWQWQLGRILKGKQQRQAAIEAYSSAVATHSQISGEIAANREAQFSFQESGENLYREAVSLLLQPTEAGKPSQSDLREARQVMESLQIASLNNFFRDNCLESAELTELQQQNTDPTAAIFYPIILSDRLGVIVSLADKPLIYYESKVTEQEIEKTLANFRYTVVIRSQWDFLPFGAQLYDWLIRPAKPILEEMGVKTVVFVPDIDFRNIPLAALVSDPINRHYLIEEYQLAITPSLQLFPTVETALHPISVLLGGITVEQLGTLPLPYVGQEIRNIQKLVAENSLVLKNEALNRQNLETALRTSNFPIVHLATHGIFSSNFEDTLLVIWQNVLNIRQLGNLLELNRFYRNNTIELLVLSACETATGDQRAALGLAGMAVRSGAKSTLATLWSVNDEGTAHFMQKFYEKLVNSSQTPSKAEAVKLAQQDLLKEKWYSHPFYWSAFVLVGNWQ